MIETILERIRLNNGPSTGTDQDALLAGRREAYEDVLYLLGFYDEDRDPLYKRRD